MDQWKHFGHHWKMNFGQKGWLRPAVLGVLEQEPATGIEIIHKIGDMSHGWWRPSPGSIYPLLQSLCNEKIIKKRDDGKYELLNKYKEEFGVPGETDEILTNMEGNTSYLEELSKANQDELNKYRKRIEQIQHRLSKLK